MELFVYNYESIKQRIVKRKYQVRESKKLYIAENPKTFPGIFCSRVNKEPFPIIKHENITVVISDKELPLEEVVEYLKKYRLIKIKNLKRNLAEEETVIEILSKIKSIEDISDEE